MVEKVVDKRSGLHGRMVSSTGEILASDADTRRDAVPPGGRFPGAAMPYRMRLNSSGIGTRMKIVY